MAKHNPRILMWKSVHGSTDVVIYDMPDINIVKWFELVDIWGSRGYDRFNDGGLFYELPKELYDIIPNLYFVKKYSIKIDYPEDYFTKDTLNL